MAVAWHCACSLIWRRCSLSWLYGTESYSYDSLYRLTGVTYTDGITQTYTYDSTGNRTAKIEAGSTITYTYDAADRLTYANTDSYSFDANGNLKQRVSGTITATYCYDALDRLIVSTNQSSCPTLPVRVNAGGALYNDSNGDDWAADMGFSGGNAYYFSAAIAGTIDDTLYQYVRSGATNFSYAIGLPSGNYTVTLKFAETYYNSAGQRVFDVLAEGVTVIDNLDVYAAAGGKNVAYDRTFVVTVTDGTLNLSFAGQVSTAMVSAVEVLPVPAALPVSYSYRADGLRASKTISGTAPITYTWDINAGLPVIVQDSSYSYVYGLGG